MRTRMMAASGLILATAFLRTLRCLPNGLQTAYTASGAFPTSLYASYYNDPTATTAEPQPVISDPVTHQVYPYWLTKADEIPQNDTTEVHPLPVPANSSALLEAALAQIASISSNPVFANDTCSACQASLVAAKFLVMAAPDQGPALAVRLCEYFKYSATVNCETTYGINTLASVMTQVIAAADVGGYDGQMICNEFLSLCPRASTSPLDLDSWFAKPKPNPLPPPKQPTEKRLKVLHLSDLHIDPRYAIGAEANCSQFLCCRVNSYNDESINRTTQSAPRFGAFNCDSPYPLITAVLEAIPALTGTEDSGFNFTIYTGDLIPHDPSNELSRAYTIYSESVLYDLIKSLVNTGPVYAVQGNHDTYNMAMDSPHNLDNGLVDQFAWNYDHLSGLWELEEWIDADTAQQARAHYSAYSVQRQDGLRIVTINTDFWYTQNYFNYINLASSDNSGMLRFLTDELQDAEDTGERVWILGHVLSGWDGTEPLENPSNLFYQIVDRYSPHVIAGEYRPVLKGMHYIIRLGIFFGHTHEDQLSIFYANNATNISAENAQTVAWIAPSVTPLTNLNSGFRVYEIDSGTFEILDAYTWQADVNAFGGLDGQTEFGPTFELEYSARDAYGGSITEWGADDPLNATWWHLVTEAMERNSSLIQLYNLYQSKSSVLTPECTGECLSAKICYLRSGSASLAVANCPAGYGTTQSGPYPG